MEKITNKTGLYISFIVGMIFILIYYTPIIISPNHYLFSMIGDGTTNYYSFAYHIANDKSFIEFTGEHYPYYEIITYLDCNPFLSTTLKALSYIIPPIKNNAIGIYNILMLLSIVVSVGLVYLILTKYKVVPWIAVIASIGIVSLSPQILRFSGHYTMSFMYVIPLSWFLLLKYFEENKKRKYILFLLIHHTISLFTHPYLGTMTIAFIAIYFLLYLIFYFKRNSEHFIKLFHFLIIVIIPLLLFKLFIFIVDTHTGRPLIALPQPLTSHLVDIFVQWVALFQNFFKTIINIGYQEWDCVGYVGITTIFKTFISLLVIILLIIRKKFQLLSELFSKKIIIVLFSGILLLLVAMGYPFNLKVDFFQKWFPFVYQFRVIGRFNWVFFYVSTILSTVLLYSFVQQIKSVNLKKATLGLTIILLSLYFIEGKEYHREFSQLMIQSPNGFNKKDVLPMFQEGINAIKNKKYQAIIPLPYYHNGSEEFKIPGTIKSRYYSQAFSYHLSLPILGGYLTRTSIEECRNMVQVISPNLMYKPIQHLITSRIPFLVVCSNETLTEYEQHLVNKCTAIFSNNEYSLYEISYEKLFEDERQIEYNHFLEIKDMIFAKNGLLISDSSAFVYLNSFDFLKSNIVFSGEGAFSGMRNQYLCLDKFEANILRTDKEYVASMWVYNKGFFENNAMIGIAEVNPSGIGAWKYIDDAKFSQVIFGNWSLVDLKFYLSDAKSTFSVFALNELLKKVIYIDNLLIRPVGIDVYKVIPTIDGKYGEIYKNNLLIFKAPKNSILIKEDSSTKRKSYFIHKIKSDPEWLKAIEVKANQRCVSIEKMIEIDAEYMVIEEKNINK